LPQFAGPVSGIIRIFVLGGYGVALDGRDWQRGKRYQASLAGQPNGRATRQTLCRASSGKGLMTDDHLLKRFVNANDTDAFRLLVEKHGPMVLAVCRSVLRNDHDVEDAFQNTCVSLALSARTIKQSKSIGPWLHRVAIRSARKLRSDANKRRARERATIAQGATATVSLPDFSSQRLVRDEVSRLPDRYRLPLVLCYLEGKSNGEAAVALHCPVGTIKGRLWRARQALRERLARRGLEFQAATP
jgi:HlyD family secretion protein